MITSVAVQAYLTCIGNLLMGQGLKGIFRDPSISEAVLKNMRVVYDSEGAMVEEWLSDEMASAKMERKGTTTKDDVRSGPFMALFWKRTSLEPIVRQRYRVLDTVDDPTVDGVYGKSTVSASFTIACVFVSNKAEAIEDLEEAFAAVFQNTYNMPLTLEYIYNAGEPEQKKTNFTYIQNMGESDLVNFKEGNLFAYSWSATIYMNYVSEFAWSRVFPVEKVVVDLYDPKGIPLASLDASGKAHTHTHMYENDKGEMVAGPIVPDEPLVAFTSADPRDYGTFAITMPYAIPYTEWNDYTSAGIRKAMPNPEDPKPFPPDKAPGNLHNTYASETDMKTSPPEYEIEKRRTIEGTVREIGGEISIRSTPYMVVVRVPLSDYHRLIDDKVHERLPDGSTVIRTIERESTHDEDMMEASRAIAAAIKTETGEDYIVSMFPDPELVVYDGSDNE